MKQLELTIDEWDLLADNVHEYLKIKMSVLDGAKVVLKDKCGNVYACLKIDEIDNIKYVYKGFID